ncbi:MAG: hypothetical protein ACXACG_12185 [Candidatus Thorarchaeota archaeon]|jgi:hypothetical protein
MTEEENHIDNSEDWVELQIKHQDSILSTRGTDWSEVIARAAIGDIKFRASKITNHTVTYNPEAKRMTTIFKESVGKIKIRIALALLLGFPERISRTDLVLMSDIKPERIREYLTNPDKGVTTHVDENDSGIVLNVKGFDWAVKILKSLENTQPQKTSIGGNSVEQPTTEPEDSTEEESQ